MDRKWQMLYKVANSNLVGFLPIFQESGLTVFLLLLASGFVLLKNTDVKLLSS